MMHIPLAGVQMFTRGMVHFHIHRIFAPDLYAPPQCFQNQFGPGRTRWEIGSHTGNIEEA